MDVTTIIYLYIALVIVITLHELGHFPKKIRFKFFPFPSAAAMQAKYRLGGLIANVIIFSLIFIYRPENVLIQYIGLVAWIHFILYAIFGSILPEKKESRVNIKTHVFDDVPNNKAIYFITGAIISIFVMQEYYVPILAGVFT